MTSKESPPPWSAMTRPPKNVSQPWSANDPHVSWTDRTAGGGAGLRGGAPGDSTAEPVSKDLCGLVLRPWKATAGLTVPYPLQRRGRRIARVRFPWSPEKMWVGRGERPSWGGLLQVFEAVAGTAELAPGGFFQPDDLLRFADFLPHLRFDCGDHQVEIIFHDLADSGFRIPKERPVFHGNIRGQLIGGGVTPDQATRFASQSFPMLSW